MSHELEPSSGHDRTRPFGSNGVDVGMCAAHLIEKLQAQPETTEQSGEQTWLKEDDQALDELLELEWYIPFIDPSAVGADHVIRMVGCIDDLHSALPFTTAERHWLVSCYRNLAPEWKENYRLSNRKMALMDKGVHEIVEVSNIMRRWHSWRRQTDEFEGHQSLHMAGNALRWIAGATAPDVSLPGNDAIAA